MNGGRERSSLWVMRNELDILYTATLKWNELVLYSHLRTAKWPTFGIVIVLIIFLAERFQRRRVLSLTFPSVGFKIDKGTIKSDVRMTFFCQSTVRPWGLKFSPRTFAIPAGSSGNSWVISPSALVSTRRPGEVPAAASACQWLDRI